MPMYPADYYEQDLALKLESLSFIKCFPSKLLENSSFYLYGQLSGLCLKHTAEDLNLILNTFTAYWADFLKNEEWAAKYYKTNFERLSLLLDFFEEPWTQIPLDETRIETNTHEVAMAVAVEALKNYLSVLLSKGEHYHFELLYQLDETHQAHFLAQELKFKYKLNKNKRDSYISESKIVKTALANKASNGGRAKALKRMRLKQYILELYESNSSYYQSALHASQVLADKALPFCESNNIPPLAPSNTQRTIYEWIRAWKNNK